MKTPEFWYRPPGLLALLLSPFGWLYGFITSRRMARIGLSADIPVICVGNFTAGGAGKTPTAIAMAKLLQDMNERPFVVSRGYGGSARGPLRVDPSLHKATDCGDEPLLLARHAPTIVSKDRAEGVRTAIAAGATVVVLDDGLQNSALQKDFTVCVVDGAVGIGNGRCVPAGPLRAPLQAQLGFVDLVLVLGQGKPGETLAESMKRYGKPCIAARILPDPEDVQKLQGRRLLAFAGIGRPEKFFATLRDAGLDVAETRAFADHQVFSDADLASVSQLASAQKLTLVTTEKDAVRIGNSIPDVAILGISLDWAGNDLKPQLKAAIEHRRYPRK
ncbi:MAG: tetraacyldisaccharide 4'-kinase [Beijerinckiaceae bacterium]